MVVVLLLCLFVILKLPKTLEWATIALVAVTLMYVMVTYGTLGEMRQQRISQEKYQGLAIRMGTNMQESLRSIATNLKEKVEDEEITRDEGDLTTDMLSIAWMGVYLASCALIVQVPEIAREYKDTIVGSLRDAGLNRKFVSVIETELTRIVDNFEERARRN